MLSVTMVRKIVEAVAGSNPSLRIMSGIALPVMQPIVNVAVMLIAGLVAAIQR